MNMYEVRAKCGHVGRGNYIEKTFAIKARSGKEAAAIARQKPRVKHHHKDAIRYVIEIDVDRYREILRQHDEDPYMHCRNIQEQKALCELSDVRKDEHNQPRRASETHVGGKDRYYRKQKLRHPRKYINKYISHEEYAS